MENNVNNVTTTEVPLENKVNELQNKVQELQKQLDQKNSKELETEKVRTMIDLVTDVLITQPFRVESKKDSDEIEFSGILNLNAIKEVIKFIPEIA